MYDHWIPQWVAALPWWVKWAFMAGIGFMSAFLPTVLGLSWQMVGVVIGGALTAVAFLGAVTHTVNKRREKRGQRRLKLEPSHLIILGLVIALAGAIWQWHKTPPSDPQTVALQSEIAKLKQQLSGPKTPITKLAQMEEASAPAQAPFYTRADTERLLDAMYEISGLLQKAIPIRDAMQHFGGRWNEIILSDGQNAASEELHKIRLNVQSLHDEGWAISNKYTFYNKEIAPIISGMSFAQKFFMGLDKFQQAIGNLPPNADRRTLTLIEPARAEFVAGIAAFQNWMSDTYTKETAATERFRTMAQKSE